MSAYCDPQSHMHLTQADIKRVEKSLIAEFPVVRQLRRSNQPSQGQSQVVEAISSGQNNLSTQNPPFRNSLTSFMEKYSVAPGVNEPTNQIDTPAKNIKVSKKF